jgi:hypothetical protein
MPEETLNFVLEFMMQYGKFSKYDISEQKIIELTSVDDVFEILRPTTISNTTNFNTIFQYDFDNTI